MMRLHNALGSICLLCLLALMMLSSCTRRPLEEEWQKGDYAEILLVTDWSLLDEVPTGMTALFFPEDGSSNIQIISNNTRENTIRLRKGKYRALIFNQSMYEFGSMTFSGIEDFFTAAASLNKLSPNSTVTAADYKWLSSMLSNPDSLEMAVREPEPFNADRLEYEVTDEMCQRQYYKDIAADDVDVWDVPTQKEYIDTIFSTPPPVPPTLHIKVRVKGINNAYQVRGYITNMARTNVFGPHVNTEEPAIHVIGQWTIHKDATNDKTGDVTSDIRCFGVPYMKVSDILDFNWGARAASSREIEVVDYGDNTLILDFLLRDNTHRQFDFTVTDDITYDKDQLLLDLELEVGAGEDDFPIVLPDVPDIIGSGGAGFDANVDDWKNEDHNILF